MRRLWDLRGLGGEVFVVSLRTISKSWWFEEKHHDVTLPSP